MRASVVSGPGRPTSEDVADGRGSEHLLTPLDAR